MAGKGGKRKGAGRPKGVPNKITTALKDAILQAATLAGDQDGLIGYLKRQALGNPGPFLALLGKVLPLQISGDPDNPLEVISRIERVIVGAQENATDRDLEVPTSH